LNDAEKSVLNKIDDMKDEIIEFHHQIVQIPSEVPPGKYRPISKFVAEKMKEIGLITKIKRNNVIGEIGGENGHTLMFNAHLDTYAVHDGWTKDPYKAEIIDNKIYGRGSADDKACIAAEMFAVKALIETGIELNGKLILTGVVNEEIGGLGTEYLLDEGIITGDACLLGDVSCDYPVAYRGGILQVTFKIKGIRRQALSYPDLSPPNRNKYSGINAIHKMYKIIEFLMELQEELKMTKTSYPIPPDMSSKVSHVSITKIEGGSSFTTVPDECVLHCIICIIPELNIDYIKSKILNFIKEIEEKDPNLNITVQMPVQIEPQITNINTDFAKKVKCAFKTVFNEEREFKLFIPTTDAHLFQQNGIETILIGPLRGDSNIHAQDEFVYIEDLINVTKIFAITALNYLK
jgi:acetylornithine deacetylase